MRPLTERQQKVIKLIALGMTHKEIARKLDIQPATVKDYKVSISRNLETETTKSMVLVNMARRYGYLALFLGLLNILPIPSRIAPKTAPKRHHTEQVVRRALPKFKIEQYQAA